MQGGTQLDSAQIDDQTPKITQVISADSQEITKLIEVSNLAGYYESERGLSFGDDYLIDFCVRFIERSKIPTSDKYHSAQKYLHQYIKQFHSEN